MEDTLGKRNKLLHDMGTICGYVDMPTEHRNTCIGKWYQPWGGQRFFLEDNWRSVEAGDTALVTVGTAGGELSRRKIACGLQLQAQWAQCVDAVGTLVGPVGTA